MSSHGAMSAATGRGSLRAELRRSLPFYGFIAPWLIGLVLLTVFPLAFALGLSFTNWDGVSVRWSWVALANYQRALVDPGVWASLVRTLALTAFIVPFNIVGSLALALVLNRKVPGRYLFRTLVFLPSIIPPVAAALVWKLLFNRDSGAVNGVLDVFGVDAIQWFSGQYVFFVLILVLIWGVGGGVLINLAALQDISADLYDAAAIDGAGPVRSFLTVTLPAISPMLLYQTVTQVIGAFQTFVPVLLLSPQTGPAAITAIPEANRIYMVEVYSQYFAFNRYGYASALLWLLFLVILAITAVTFKLSARTVFYAVDPNAQGK